MQQYLNIFQHLATEHFRQDRAVSEPINTKNLENVVDFSLDFEGADIDALEQAASQYLTNQPDSAQVDFF